MYVQQVLFLQRCFVGRQYFPSNMGIDELQANFDAELLLLAEYSEDVGENDENILPLTNLKLFDIDLEDLIPNPDATGKPKYHIQLRQNQENNPDADQERIHQG